MPLIDPSVCRTADLNLPLYSDPLYPDLDTNVKFFLDRNGLARYILLHLSLHCISLTLSHQRSRNIGVNGNRS